MQLDAVVPGQPTYPTYPPGAYCPPAAPIAASMLDAAGNLVNQASTKLSYALNGSFTPNDAAAGAQLFLNGVDMLTMAFPQASTMTSRFANDAQQVLAGPTVQKTQILLADVSAANQLVGALRPHAS